MNKNNTIIDMNDLFKKIAFHWPLYLIVVAVAVTGALSYLRYAKPRYLSSAKLYLKDDDKKGGGEEMDMLKSLSLFNNGKNIENEMEVLKSPILVGKVIQDNNFNIRYFKKGTVSNEELYEHNPLNLHFLTDSSQTGNYTLDVTPENGLLKIKSVDDASATPFTIHAGEPFTIRKDRFSISYDPVTAEQNVAFRIRIDSIPQLAYEKIEDIGTALVNRDATVIVVTYEDRVAKRTAHFLNALLDTYNEYTLDDKNRVALKTIRFLTVRIDSLKDELGFLERQEESFKVKRGITDIEGNSKLALEQEKQA
ncbi:hypothetical protein GO495_04215 [Chitinophaga oryziterrae]|uniref:Polysaccharide chain length determinant N-terminal domain-containing protein n=1 Tax=Chitinophaga oryziterrae TaxID=1031224 RepID=A0A6N8J3J5_9BACT|nr:Wzz/FepE/Etk N-terminal domain-containing protein [Chitinophaga oryziterrae]MVT39777.1 hypothetical protein [Chitinophaga oryziterrae]